MLSANIYLFNVSNSEGNIKRSCNAEISYFHYIYCLVITSRFQYSELLNAYKSFVAFPYLNVFKKYCTVVCCLAKFFDSCRKFFEEWK